LLSSFEHKRTRCGRNSLGLFKRDILVQTRRRDLGRVNGNGVGRLAKWGWQPEGGRFVRRETCRLIATVKRGKGLRRNIIEPPELVAQARFIAEPQLFRNRPVKPAFRDLLPSDAAAPFPSPLDRPLAGRVRHYGPCCGAPKLRIREGTIRLCFLQSAQASQAFGRSPGPVV
jgi:hypothetical protein